MTPSHPLALATWRRAITDLYATVRIEARTDRRQAWSTFCAGRNKLFAQHPQTPLTDGQLRSFRGIDYYSYNPDLCFSGDVEESIHRETLTYELGDDGTLRATAFALARFTMGGREQQLTLYWIEGYGGGLFLPFRDASCGQGTYGGGRYLYDTIKGADPGLEAGRIALDFNFAYNPSCAYNSQWTCPLSPPQNRLAFAVEAGERFWTDE